jgi:6-phosphogluconolactonase
MQNIHIFTDAGAVERAAAEMFVEHARDAVAARGVFRVALAGGSTPRRLYALLADGQDSFRQQVPWDRIHFFWGDERHVPPDHADSNYRMANEAMLAHVPVPPENVHRIRAENPNAAQAAEEYVQQLRDCFGPGTVNLPRLDFILLGMGGDGHTASLFPGTAALQEQNQWMVSNWVEKFQTHRITMTPPLLNNGACVVFLVQGEEKVEPLRAVLYGERKPQTYPSQLIQPVDGDCHWLVDRAAAKLLPDLG